MLRNLKGLALLLVVVLVWVVGVIALAPLAVFDDFCGWVNRRFDVLFRDIW